VQEFRKCIECFLCQNVCHVLRDHEKKEQFGGPRFFVRIAGLEMHPLDGLSRTSLLKMIWALAYVISPSAAPKCVLRIFILPTIRSFL
jgi:hypothetical protein